MSNVQATNEPTTPTGDVVKPGQPQVTPAGPDKAPVPAEVPAKKV